MSRELLYREIDYLGSPGNRHFEIKASADFSFATLAKKYPGYKDAGFATGNAVSSIVLYTAIGGNFAQTALRKKGKSYVIEPGFNNSCTVRMSTALNFGGDPIKRYRGITTLKGTRTGKLRNKKPPGTPHYGMEQILRAAATKKAIILSRLQKYISGK